MHLCTLPHPSLLLDSLHPSPSGRVAVSYQPITRRDKSAMPVLAIGEAAALVVQVAPKPFSADYPAAPLVNALSALRDCEAVQIYAQNGAIALEGGSKRFSVASGMNTPEQAVKRLLGASRAVYGLFLYHFSGDAIVIDAGAKRYRIPHHVLSAQEWFSLLTEENTHAKA